MKILNCAVVVQPCKQGNHFNAYIEVNWSNGDQSVIFCPTCFGTESLARAEGEKAIPIMTEALNKQAIAGNLKDGIGMMIAETTPSRDPNPNLH